MLYDEKTNRAFIIIMKLAMMKSTAYSLTHRTTLAEEKNRKAGVHLFFFFFFLIPEVVMCRRVYVVDVH